MNLGIRNTAELNRNMTQAKECCVDDYPCPPPPPGVQSALQELSEVVHLAMSLAADIRNFMGLSTPEPQKTPMDNGTLAGTIRDLAKEVRSTSNHLSEVLEHLRS